MSSIPNIPPARPREAHRAEAREASLFIRRRFEFAGALLFGALVPWIPRGSLLPGRLFEHASINTLAGNAVAVVIALWMRLSIGPIPASGAARIALRD